MLLGNLPPVNEKGENLYYYVEETSVENYKATYEKNGNTITIKNKKNDGGLEINKQWVDKDGNPTSPTVNNITVNLKRALTAPSQTTSSGTGSDTREDGLEIVGQVDYPRYNGGVVDITDSTNSKVVKAMTENVRNKVSKIEITVVGSPNGAFQYNCDQSGNNGSSNIQLNTSTIDLDNISLTSNYIKLDME